MKGAPFTFAYLSADDPYRVEYAQRIFNHMADSFRLLVESHGPPREPGDFYVPKITVSPPNRLGEVRVVVELDLWSMTKRPENVESAK